VLSKTAPKVTNFAPFSFASMAFFEVVLAMVQPRGADPQMTIKSALRMRLES